MPERPYTYYDFTLSSVHTVLKSGCKSIFEEGKVFMLKNWQSMDFKKC
jgi:hypothetical protein